MSLSPRQREVLSALAAGRKLKQAASDIGISLGTAKGHITASRQKLGARTSEHAVALAIRQGLIA